jgi:hypothetical protein
VPAPDSLELGQLAVEGVDDLLVERQDVGSMDQFFARAGRPAEILQPALSA